MAVDSRPVYDETCYLCPTNKRADGTPNPVYENSFVFVNDFSALLNNTPKGSINESDLLIAESQSGICKVISFSPRHDLMLAQMKIAVIKKVVDVWQDGKSTSLDPLPPRRFKRKNEWGMGVGIAGISSVGNICRVQGF